METRNSRKQKLQNHRFVNLLLWPIGLRPNDTATALVKYPQAEVVTKKTVILTILTFSLVKNATIAA